MNTPSWWQHQGVIAQLLRPVSLVWQLATMLRRARATPEKLGIPVWCVGNVAAGGGGKTPFCLHLGAQAKQAGIHAYFVARGYGGSMAEPTLVDITKHHSHEVGDEALLLAACLPTITAHKRIEAARYAAKLGAQLIIMDDGMQYPHVHQDKIFLMLKGDAPVGNGYILPAGPLREPLADALGRCDVVVQMDASTPPPGVQHKPLWQVTTHLQLPTLPCQKVIAFAGIAHPQLFNQQLARAGLDVVAFHAFADHRPYTDAQLQSLLDEAKALDACLLTTEKDAVRISAKYQDQLYIAKQSTTLAQEADLQLMIGEIH